MEENPIKNVEALIDEIAKGLKPKFLFFWGHQPLNDDQIGKQCLSQWWDEKFIVDGITYPTAEHYMMAQKAKLFGDKPTYQKILSVPHPSVAKRFGRTVVGFDETVWTQNDGGSGSVIFGLASFAEGVDLPGDYCRHVVIAKIPFAVPDSPLEAALAEWVEAQGRNAFMEISVPDAALRLVQASGRLLRTEQDTGRVTLMDRRILTRRYGRAILDSLPPFRRELG